MIEQAKMYTLSVVHGYIAVLDESIEYIEVEILMLLILICDRL